MLKKILAAGLLALAPLTVSAQLPAYPFIHVSGSAATKVIPDIGTLDFEIIASDADPAVARATVEARIAEIQALVAEQGLPVDDVAIRDLRQDIRKGDPAATIYDIKCTVHLKVRDLTKWRAVAGGLLAKPNLDGFSTDFGTTERAKVETALTDEAIKDAQRRAEAMAAGFGRKLGPVTAVTPDYLKNLSRAMGLVPADFFNRGNSTKTERAARDQIVNITVLDFAQRVDVIFRIK